jgi:transmembrane sensor
MKSSDNRLRLLLNLYFEQQISDAQKAELWDYINDPKFSEQIRSSVPDATANNVDSLKHSEASDDRILNFIFTHGESTGSLTKRKRLWPNIAKVAASIVLICIGGYLYLRFDPKSKNEQHVRTSISPGKNSATLTLANGKTIILSDTIRGLVAEEAGVSIQQTANGQVVYTILNNSASEANHMNVLSTAKGQTYRVILPDGTQVWLNAASSLTYPTSFSNLNRKVILNGEGYFEVAKDRSHPFIVATNQQEITVLGTRFNINAYTNENAIRTTLLEGSIKLKVKNKETMLKPGQQSVVFDSQLKTLDIDTALSTAWKNNNLMFDGERIDYIMRMIERWYNVEVIYKSPISNEKFYGSVSRQENVLEVLKTMESSGKIHFEVEGRKIIVTN